MKRVMLFVLLFCSCKMEDIPTEQRALYLEENSSYNVLSNFEFVMHEEQMLANPIVADAFINAVAEWSCNIPIRASIYVNVSDDINYLKFRTRAIEVLIDDLQRPPYNNNGAMLGYWESFSAKLALDADMLGASPELAYSVSLHELGHVFGLPHIINYADMAETGNLVLDEQFEARSYVMYPTIDPEFKQNSLSSLEIEIAMHHVVFSCGGVVAEISRCYLTQPR